jgi:phosphatidylglycerol---prolipoprotein diacylglyceryl transferase
MITLAALTFPNIDPVALNIGPMSIKWYGLSYMAGLIVGWLYIRRLVSTPMLWANDTPPFGVERADDVLLYMTLSVILGGRLGQVLLYDPGYYFAHPVEILETWRGGMSFHGAVIASLIAIFLFARHNDVSARSVMDVCCAASPVGLILGRIANFINSEHWGRVTDASVGIVFPNGGDLPRHPSQLYESALEGVVMLLVMRVMTHKVFGLKQPGLVAGVWLVWYAIARIICEFFREPETLHALNIEPFTAGQVYCLPMLAFGAYLIVTAQRSPSVEKPAA